MNRRLLGMLITAYAFCITLSCSDKSTDIAGIALNDSTLAPLAVTPAVKPGTVTDLKASATGSSGVTLSFTQVDDGTGQPAKYDVRYALAPISWGSATAQTSGTCNTPVAGTAIGSQLSCTVVGLTPAKNYNFQLVAFRGTLNLNAVFGSLSSIVSATTTGSSPPPPVPVASVSVSPASSTLQIGATVQLLVTARDANDSVLTGRIVTSSSADTAIASVNSLGLVTAISAGTTQITVTSEGKSAVATITVSALAPPPAVKPGTVTDLKASATGSSGVTLSFTQVDDGTGQPAKYDVRYALAPISWGSATAQTSGTCNTPVAGTAIGSQLSCTVVGLTPAKNYNFQLVAFRGTLNLNAVFGSLSSIVSATTTGSSPPPPVPVASVSVSPASSTLQIGATVQLQVTARDANNNVLTGRVVTSSSANPAIASVNSLGLVTAISAGTTQITVTSEGKSAIATITVTAPPPMPVATVSVSPTTATLQVGATIQIAATERDANNTLLTGRVVTWSSGNTGTSTVSSAGLITAVAPGNAMITATSEGKTATSAISVSAPVPPPSGTAEPTGMSVITNRPFNSLNELGWSDSFSSNMAFIADATAPQSPSGILRATYPTGYTSSGTGPGGADYMLSSSPRTIYVSFWSKLSSNFFGHDSGTNKQFYVYDLGGNPWFFFSVYGVGTGPLMPMIQFQSTTSNGDYDLAPNLVPSARIPRNAWYHIEVVATGNTAGTADGTIDVWLNGVHVTSTAGLPNGRLQYSSGACHWGRFHYTTIWGGVGGPNVPATMTVDWDNVYLSGKQ